jgi:hypothetical protein
MVRHSLQELQVSKLKNVENCKYISDTQGLCIGGLPSAEANGMGPSSLQPTQRTFNPFKSLFNILHTVGKRNADTLFISKCGASNR